MMNRPRTGAAVLAALLGAGGCQSLESIPNPVSSLTGGRHRVLVATSSTPATAPDVPWSPAPGAENSFEAACPRIEPVRQETPVWCWAACAQMIHASYGTPISQAELARRIHGEDDGTARVHAAAYREIMLALNPDTAAIVAEHAADQVSRASTFELTADPRGLVESLAMQYRLNSDVIVHELQRGAPVVVVLDEQDPENAMEHAYVLHRVGYSVEPRSVLLGLFERRAEQEVDERLSLELLNHETYPKYYSIRWVELIDPEIGESVRLSGDGFRERAMFMISKERAREILRKQYGIVQLK